NATGPLPFATAELNQCEPGYGTYPDVASTGQLEQGILINLSVSDWYKNPANDCTWASDWALPAAGEVQASPSCRVFDASAAGGPLMGINLGDEAQRRCPSWTACDVGSFCCLAVLQPGDASCIVRIDGSVWCAGRN